MKKTLLLAIISLLSFNSIKAQQTEKRNLGHFAKIEIEGKIKIQLIKNKNSFIEIELSDKYNIDKVISKVRFGKLKLYYEKKYEKEKDPNIVIYLHYKSIQEVIFNGVITFNQENAINESELTINGNGIIGGNLKVNVEKLNLGIKGVSKNLIISGKATKAYFSIEGNGEINAEHLKTRNITKNISGLATIKSKK